MQQELSNAVSHAWDLDIELDEQRPIKFFGFIVFQDGPVDNASIIKELSSRLIDTIRYQQALLEGNRVSITMDDFFEQCLQKMNLEIANFLRDISAPLPIQSWAMLVGMVSPDTNPKRLQFYTSRFGKITGWLLNNAQLDTKKLISIFDAPDIIPSHQIPQKFFQNILTSTLPVNDQLFFCTPNILNYISLTEMKHVLSTLSAAPALKHFENQIQFRPNDHMVAGVTLKLSPYPVLDQQPLFQEPDNVQDSIDTLLQTQSETQKLLGNQTGIGLGSVKGFFEGLANQAKQKLSPHSSELVPNATQQRSDSVFIQVIQTTVKTSQLIASRSITFLQSKMGKSMPKRSAMEMIHTNQQVTKTSIWKKRLALVAAPISNIFKTILRSNILKQPVFYVVVGVLIIAFIGFGSFRSSQQEKAQLLADAESEIQVVRDNVDKIDAYLIVGRESDAITLVQESNQKLAALASVETLNDQRAELEAKIAEQQGKLRKETVLSEPFELIKDAQAFLSSPAQGIELTPNALIVLGQSPQSLVSISRADELKSTIELTTDMTQWTSVVSDNANGLLAINGNAITPISLTSGQGTSIVANAQTSFRGAAFFNNRLYTLSPETNQIARSNQSNYSVLSNWIADESRSIQNARDLAIDGSIYVLLPDSLIQYNSGRPANPGINLDPIDPPLADAQKVWTNPDTNRLYILEPTRLLIYEKTGRFVGQYLIQDSAPFVDLTVDVATKTVYLLSEAKLYKLENL